jgi:hypothetical protein
VPAEELGVLDVGVGTTGDDQARRVGGLDLPGDRALQLEVPSVAAKPQHIDRLKVVGSKRIRSAGPQIDRIEPLELAGEVRLLLAPGLQDPPHVRQEGKIGAGVRLAD